MPLPGQRLRLAPLSAQLTAAGFASSPEPARLAEQLAAELTARLETAADAGTEEDELLRELGALGHVLDFSDEHGGDQPRPWHGAVWCFGALYVELAYSFDAPREVDVGVTFGVS